MIIIIIIGEGVDLTQYDIHVVSGVLKGFLRETIGTLTICLSVCIFIYIYESPLLVIELIHIYISILSM